jgi:hypothetical protein
MKNGRYIENGIEFWYKDDKLHRDDGPAIIDTDGNEEWWKDGKYIESYKKK